MSFVLPIAVIIFGVVLLLIIVRQVGKVRLPIWAIMTAGAVFALLTGSISPYSAFLSINFEIIAFLFGMFILGVGMERSGLLHRASLLLFGRAATRKQILLWFIFLMATASAVLMNDTVAIIGTPIALYCVQRYKLPVATMLIALAASVTFGSVMTPIGNPQALLIAMSGGIPDPFQAFFLYMLVPAALSLYVLYLMLVKTLPDPNASVTDSEDTQVADDVKLSRLVKVSLGLVLTVIGLRFFLGFLGVEVPFLAIALVACVPLLLLSPRRVELFKDIDWSTLLFFAAMFVMMAAVWQSGFIQQFLPEAFTSSMPLLFTASLLVPQLVSNVPYVALVLPLLHAASAPVQMYITLAAGSTISGTLTILGAASTVIIIQNAEKHGQTLTFFQYFRVGLPLTIVAAGIFLGWILLVSFI